MGIIAGILLILMGVAHNIYGEKKQSPQLKELTKDSIMIGSLRIMIYQGGMLLLAVGIVQILVSINYIELIGISRYFPVGIVVLNFVIYLFFMIFFYREILKITIPQIIIFSIIICMQLLSL